MKKSWADLFRPEKKEKKEEQKLSDNVTKLDQGKIDEEEQLRRQQFKNNILKIFKMDCKKRGIIRELQETDKFLDHGFTGHWWFRLPLPGNADLEADYQYRDSVRALEELTDGKISSPHPLDKVDESVIIAPRQILGDRSDAYDILIGDGWDRSPPLFKVLR
jgi:hypothetical protein